MRQHLEAVYRQTKQKPDELIQPDIPRSVRYLINLFVELSQGRQHSMAGACQITACEIEAWLRLTQRKLSAWEIDTLRAMDRGFVNG